MNRLLAIVALKAILNFANGNVAYPRAGNHLHPVHGLYVKPSVDGTTGDLYVAATEDSGVKTQWLTDHPIHFLPMHSQQPAIPTGYSTEELNTRKRAVVNPPVQYTYALPSSQQSEPSPISAYPYTMPAAIPSSPPVESKTEVPAPAVVPQYNPYQFFYPQMLSSYANMINILKDAGLSDETASSVVSQASPMWSHSYAYPYQYVMVDPNAWAQAQSSSASPVTPSTTANPTANDNE